MRKFTVSFVIPASQLTTVVSVLTDSVINLNIQEIDPPAILKIKPKDFQAIRNSPRRQRVPETLKSVLADGKPHPLSDVGPALKQAGLSENSVSPGISKLAADGVVVRVEHGTYLLKKVGNSHASKV